MRAIDYEEILNNINCGLVVFIEDDFDSTGTIELNEILCNIIRLNDCMYARMIEIIKESNDRLAEVIDGFAQIVRKKICLIQDWNSIIDIEDVLNELDEKDPDSHKDREEAYNICHGYQDEMQEIEGILVSYGVWGAIPPNYKPIFEEFIQVDTMWKPVLIFNHYDSDVAEEIKNGISRLISDNECAVCLIDDGIRGEERADEIVQMLKNHCKNNGKKAVGAIVTSRTDNISQIDEDVYFEYVSKTKMEQLKQALLRSAYHYFLGKLKNRKIQEITKAIGAASAHPNIAIYLATMARIEGVSNYEVIKQWIDAICESGNVESDGLTSLVAIANMLDACEESPEFEMMEDMGCINIDEAFDYQINRFFLPVAPGDIFRNDKGEIYILVGQACDMMMRQNKKRRNGLCELLKAEKVPLKWGNKTLSSLENIWINDFRDEETTTALKIDYQHRYFLDNEIISLCSYNLDGQCRMQFFENLPMDSRALMQPYQLRYYEELKAYFEAVIKVNDQMPDIYETILSDSDGKLCKPNAYKQDEQGITYNLRRIARLKDEYCLFVYKMFLEFKGRIPFNTINLARLQTVNMKFRTDRNAIDLDIDVYKGMKPQTAKKLPWIITNEKMEQIVTKLFDGDAKIKDVQEQYVLTDEELRVPLENRNTLFLKKSKMGEVMCWLTKKREKVVAVTG